MKQLGIVLLCLAVVGTITGWSAMQQLSEGGAYVVVNVLLFVVGVSLVLLGRRNRIRFQRKG